MKSVPWQRIAWALMRYRQWRVKLLRQALYEAETNGFMDFCELEVFVNTHD